MPPDRVPQAERLLSTAVFGFAVSEATGRFRDHDVDEDFAELIRWLRRALLTAALDGSAR